MVYYTSRHEETVNIAGWSSSVARRAHNPKVVSSNLAPATKKSAENTPFLALYFFAFLQKN